MSAHAQVPLGEICAINPRAKRIGPSDNTIVSFVPMAAVDERLGAITTNEVRRLAEVSKGYTAFEDGDVLFAKITPCMENGKAALARSLTNGLGSGSTEFYVLRPNERVLGEYIFHFVRQSRFREEAKKSFTGTAGQQRVPKSFIENALVPLPPLDEQRRIVAILNRAAKIERLRAKAQERLREFAAALFIEMFGDPAENPMGWDQANIGDLSQVQSGLQVTKKRYAHPIEAPYLRVANVLRGRLDLNEIKYMRVTEREFLRVQLKSGDLLIVEGHGNASEIGRAGIWNASISGCVHQNHLIRARPDQSKILSEFACAYLNSSSGREHLLRSGKTTSGLNTITTSNVKSCDISLPPLDLQRRYTQLVETAHSMVAVAETASTTASELSASLMSRLLGEGA